MPKRDTKRDTKREKIIFKAKEILAGSPDGIKYAELVKRLRDSFPDEAHGNLTGSIWNLDTRFPEEIYKPSRGLFRLTKFKTEEVASPTPELPKEPGRVREEAFRRLA